MKYKTKEEIDKEFDKVFSRIYAYEKGKKTDAYTTIQEDVKFFIHKIRENDKQFYENRKD